MPKAQKFLGNPSGIHKRKVGSRFDFVSGLGGAVADAWNRLSVNTSAVLLNNAGAGIEATVNKETPGNDAAFAFKTGFSARALRSCARFP